MPVFETVEIVNVGAGLVAFGQVMVSVFAVLVASLWLTCLYVVADGSVAVIERMGRVRGVKRPGLRIKAPWPIERVLGRVPSGQLHGGGDLALRTIDGAPVRIYVEARLTISAHEAPRALAALDDFRDGVDTLVCEHLGRRISEFSLAELTEGRGRLALELVIDLGEELKNYGLRVIDVVIGEPRTTVDVWRLRECQPPLLPLPMPVPQPAPMSKPGPTPGKPGVDVVDEENVCANREAELLRLIVAVRAVNPGMSEESILSIVYKMMDEDLVLRALTPVDDCKYDERILVVR